jgi:integrase
MDQVRVCNTAWNSDHGARGSLHQSPPGSPQSQLLVPDIRFHDLRHTCATLLLGKGVHAKFVQELLGHATISITLDTYSHVLPGMGDAAAGAMDEALG